MTQVIKWVYVSVLRVFVGWSKGCLVQVPGFTASLPGVRRAHGAPLLLRVLSQMALGLLLCVWNELIQRFLVHRPARFL